MNAALLAPLTRAATVSPSRQTAYMHNRRQAARSALLSGLFAFLVATVALSVALETTCPEWRDPEFGHRLALLKQKQPSVVVIGTSRTQNGIAPHAMPGLQVFNFGQSAATPLKELLTLRRLLDAGVKPTAVLVEVFPPALAVNATDEAELRERVTRLSAADLRHLTTNSDHSAAFWRGWLVARAAPWQTQRQVLMSHWAPLWQPRAERIDYQWATLDANGFQAVVEVSPERRAALTAMARQQWKDELTGFHPGKSSLRAVRQLVAVCQANAIPVAFVMPPISPGFQAQFAAGVLAKAEDHLLAMSKRLGVAVFPAMTDMNEDEFMDGHHMLKHGAERYSRWLADTHIKPWLAGEVHVRGSTEAVEVRVRPLAGRQGLAGTP